VNVIAPTRTHPVAQQKKKRKKEGGGKRKEDEIFSLPVWEEEVREFHPTFIYVIEGRRKIGFLCGGTDKRRGERFPSGGGKESPLLSLGCAKKKSFKALGVTPFNGKGKKEKRRVVTFFLILLREQG